MPKSIVEKSAITKKKLYALGKLKPWNKGLNGIKTRSKGIPAWNKGLKTGSLSREHKLKIANSQKGKVHTLETRKKISKSKNGLWAKEKNPNWKGGICVKNTLTRVENAFDLKIWREIIFKRDHYTCQICGQIGGELNANHIKRFIDYIKLRFSPNNGITLCKDCHFGLVNHYEKNWESYFNFNLATRRVKCH